MRFKVIDASSKYTLETQLESIARDFSVVNVSLSTSPGQSGTTVYTAIVQYENKAPRTKLKPRPESAT